MKILVMAFSPRMLCHLFLSFHRRSFFPIPVLEGKIYLVVYGQGLYSSRQLTGEGKQKDQWKKKSPWSGFFLSTSTTGAYPFRYAYLHCNMQDRVFQSIRSMPCFIFSSWMSSHREHTRSSSIPFSFLIENLRSRLSFCVSLSIFQWWKCIGRDFWEGRYNSRDMRSRNWICTSPGRLVKDNNIKGMHSGLGSMKRKGDWEGENWEWVARIFPLHMGEKGEDKFFLYRTG